MYRANTLSGWPASARRHRAKRAVSGDEICRRLRWEATGPSSPAPLRACRSPVYAYMPARGGEDAPISLRLMIIIDRITHNATPGCGCSSFVLRHRSRAYLGGMRHRATGCLWGGRLAARGDCCWLLASPFATLGQRMRTPASRAQMCVAAPQSPGRVVQSADIN